MSVSVKPGATQFAGVVTGEFERKRRVNAKRPPFEVA